MVYIRVCSSLVAQMVKNLPAIWETQDWFLGQEDILEKGMANHSSILAWGIAWTEEPGRLQSMGSRRVGQDWATSLSLFTFMHWRRKWQPTPVLLPGESQGREPGGLLSMGSHRVRHDWSDLAAAAGHNLATEQQQIFRPRVGVFFFFLIPFLEASSWNCSSLCHGFSLVTMLLTSHGGGFHIYKIAHRI